MSSAVLQSLLHSHTAGSKGGCLRESGYRVSRCRGQLLVDIPCVKSIASKPPRTHRQRTALLLSGSHDPFRNREVTCTKYLLHTQVSSLRDKLAESATSKPDATSFVGMNNWTCLCMSLATCHTTKRLSCNKAIAMRQSNLHTEQYIAQHLAFPLVPESTAHSAQRSVVLIKDDEPFCVCSHVRLCKCCQPGQCIV